MATNIENECDTEYRPAEDEIVRWQSLFSYSYSEATEQIKRHKNDISRSRISDELWALVRSGKEAQGYSREALEHEVSLRHHQHTPTHPHPSSSSSTSIPTCQPDSTTTTYLVLLSGPLTTAQQIQTIASLPSLPSIYPATSEQTGDTQRFCQITSSTKTDLQSWLAKEDPSFTPTFVRVSLARKDLSSTSRYPTLGIDSTLPQHRLSSPAPPPSSSSSFSPPSALVTANASISPRQDEYPVQYFFYGTLTNPNFLAQVLCLPHLNQSGEDDDDDREDDDIPIMMMKPASITGGVLATWGGKYKALVDGDATDVVSGVVYTVTTREREEALRVFETEAYEVVRCAIMVEGEEGRIVRGLTFRFIGSL